jgi:hypothetical protein
VRGTLVEVAYQNLHAARAQMIDLLDEDELRAELPSALARASAAMRRDDPRLVAAERLQAEMLKAGSIERLRPSVRRLVGDSYELVDLEHARLRNFRNVVLLAALIIFVLVVATVVVVSRRPDWIPLCFPNSVTTVAGASQDQGLNCPTNGGPGVQPAGADIVVVAMLGSLGGALSAALSIRNIKGTSTPYDVPVALASLKVPLGAFTAILALVAIQGRFVPGLSALDSQGQILAYAMVFGFAQHVFTRLLDRKAQDLLEGLPGGDAAEQSTKSPSPAPVPQELPSPTGAATAAAGDAEVVEINEPLQAPEDQTDQELLPDPVASEYVEDGQAESDAGPDTGDGVEYPKEAEG